MYETEDVLLIGSLIGGWTSRGTSSTIVNVPPPYDSQTKDRLAVLKIFPTDEDTTSLQVQQFRNELKLSAKFRQKVRFLTFNLENK